MERGEVDGGIREPGRREVALLELDERRRLAPVEQRQRQLRVPCDHERVALEDLAEPSLERFGPRLAARGAAARRVPDRTLAQPRVTEIDELGRQPRGSAFRQRDSLHPRHARVGREAPERKPGGRELTLGEEREPFRADGGVAELTCARDDETLVWNEGRGVALECLAHRSRSRVGTSRTRAPDAGAMAERRAEEPVAALDLARGAEEAWFGSRGEALLERAHDARVGRDRAAQPRRERLDHAAAACHGSGGAARSATEHDGHRGTRSTACSSRRNAG